MIPAQTSKPYYLIYWIRLSRIVPKIVPIFCDLQ